MLETARRLFYAGGFSGTSIETVARAAHVSPKTIYGRFGGKDGLFCAAMKGRFESILAVLRAPVGRREDVRAALVSFAKQLLTATMQDEALTMHRIMIAESQRFPDLAEAFYEFGPKRGISTVAQFLSQAAKADILQIEIPAVAAEFFVGALLGVPIRQALMTKRRMSPAAIAERAGEVVDVFMRAFACGRT